DLPVDANYYPTAGGKYKYTFEVSPEVAARMKRYIDAEKASIAPYTMIESNCTTGVADVLRQAGSDVPIVLFPGDLKKYLDSLPKDPATQTVKIPFIASGDPNNLVGPAGFGTQGWVAPQQTLPYSIEFENDPKKATAAAQDVTVTT